MNVKTLNIKVVSNTIKTSAEFVKIKSYTNHLGVLNMTLLKRFYTLEQHRHKIYSHTKRVLNLEIFENCACQHMCGIGDKVGQH